jgi:hypothetical protein
MRNYDVRKILAGPDLEMEMLSRPQFFNRPSFWQFSCLAPLLGSRRYWRAVNNRGVQIGDK